MPKKQYLTTVDYCIPLQVIRSRVSMLAIWTERAHITRTLMNEPMPDHLVLPFEAFAAFAARALLHWTVVRPQVRVHILM